MLFAKALAFYLTRVKPWMPLLVATAEKMHLAPNSGLAKAAAVLGAVTGFAQGHPQLNTDLQAVANAVKPMMEEAVTALKAAKTVEQDFNVGMGLDRG